jgi:hypothetical protein
MAYKELPVEYDYSYKGNFNKYKSFDLFSPVDKSDPSLNNETVEHAILDRMRFLGYRHLDRKPDLLLSYRIFNDSLKFVGYDQPEIESWLQTQNKYDEIYNKREFNLKSGTLAIQLYDRKQNRTVWQGFATAAYGSIDFTNTRHTRNAVISILDKYRFWAEGFMDKKVIFVEPESEL